MGSRKLLQAAGLVHRTVVLPNGWPVSYYERGSAKECTTTILLCHGMTDEAKNLAGFIKALNMDESYRILEPDLPGQFSRGYRAEVVRTRSHFSSP